MIKIILSKLVFLGLLTILGCSNTNNKNKEEKDNKSSNKIKVLNFATFHFGYTSDALKVEFDENDKKRQDEIREISKKIAAFKPTIICIENLPEYNEEINKAYLNFLKDSTILNTNYGERSMIGFDVARLSKVKLIYGIDNHMDYNYMVGKQIENTIDSITYKDYINNPFKEFPELEKLHKNFDKLSLLEKLKFYNHPKYLDFNLNINADILLYVGTDNKFEGADEATLFYQRNLRIYSNLNRIPMNKNDRVFILMGAAHASFLREFIKRSPKFEMVNTLDYLEK